jgi:NADH-quinone oxidoreductase subunit M
MECELLVAVFSPIVAAVALPLLPTRVTKALAILASGLSLGLVACLFYRMDSSQAGFQGISELTTFADLGLSLKLGFDGISLPLLGLASFVGFLTMLFAQPKTRVKEFYFYLLLTVGAAMGAFASLNLFYFFFFCELATLPKYMLVAIFGECHTSDPSRLREKRAALKLTLFIAGGALLVLIGLTVLFVDAGQQFDLLGMQIYLTEHPLSLMHQSCLFALLVLGFGIWTTMWPFHSWAPVAYEAAPPAANMMFAGVLKNLGAYGILRVAITLLPEGAAELAQPLAILATINIVYGALLAMRQTRWHDLVAYSSISHAGYVLLGLATLSTLGLTASVLFMVVHGLLMALMFALVGHLQIHSRSITKNTGLAAAMPFLGFFAVAGAMATSGMAGFGNFVSELMIFFAGFKQGSPVFAVATAVAVFGMLLTAVYMLRAVRTTFFGPRSAGEFVGPCASHRLVYTLLLLGLLATGFYPSMLTSPISQSVSKLSLPRN